MLLIPPEHRRDRSARASSQPRGLVRALPARHRGAEALDLLENPQTKVIDTSTARRVHSEWVYGLPRFHPRTKNKFAGPQSRQLRLLSVGFILAVRPLIAQGLLRPTAPLTINAVSGYSGGGRSMIAEYEGEGEHKPSACTASTARTSTCPRSGNSAGAKSSRSLCRPSLFVLRHGSKHASARGIFRSSPRQSRSRVRGLARALRGLPLCQGDRTPSRLYCATTKFLDLTELSYTNFVELSVWGDPEQGFGFSRAARQSRQRSVGQCRAVPQLDARLRRDRRAGLDARR